MKSYKSRTGPYSNMAGILRKRGNSDKACPQGERHGKMKAEAWLMQPRSAKDGQQTTRSQQRGMEPILAALGRNQACRHLGLRLPAFRHVRQYIPVV